MKAALWSAFDAPLAITDVPEPVLGTGEVIVDVVATPVVAYTGEVLRGERPTGIEPPLVPGPGAVGRVRAVGPDATRLQPGDWVYCDPTVRSRDDAVAPDMALQGWAARGPGGVRLLRHYRDGGFAEQVRVPTECAIRLPAVDPARAARWCALGTYVIPYGGWLAGALAPGEVALVGGATGRFGSAGVAVALAMGAAAVVATGRNVGMLEELVRRFGPRVRPVQLVENELDDRERVQRAAPEGIDCMLDLLPPHASGAPVRALAMAVRPGGRVVLMGGVDAEVAIPYRWLMRNSIVVRGQWMYPRDACGRLVALVQAGLIDLEQVAVTEFPLVEIERAIAHAAAHGKAFTMTVVCPGVRS